MRFWRGYIHLLSSGDLQQTFFALPKKPSSAIPMVFERVKRERFSFHNRTWRASMNGFDGAAGWLGFKIGIERQTDAEWDEWDDREGWVSNAGPRAAATQGLIHIPSQTVFVQKKNQDLESPGVLFKMLTKLLNRTLASEFPDSAWIFEVEPERETTHFLARLKELEQITLFKVTLPTPNARSHNLLIDLQGEAGQAKADHVQIALSSKNGISKESSFYQKAIETFIGGLAKIVAKGFKRDSSKEVRVDSEHNKTLMEFDLPDFTEDAVLEVSSGPILATGIGFLEDAPQARLTSGANEDS